MERIRAKPSQAIPRKRSEAAVRRDLAERLRLRRADLEQTAFARVRAISDPDEVADPEYVDGLRSAVSAALDYGIAAVEDPARQGEAGVPIALLAQARLAARDGVSIDTVLRRYVAGHALLSELLIEQLDPPGADSTNALRALSARLNSLLAAVSEEYAREAALVRRASPGQRRVECVERLLAGEGLDAGELAYDLDGWHLGLLARGPDAACVLEQIAAAADRRLLVAERGEQLHWAWLGGRRPLDPSALEPLLDERARSAIVVATGEPGEGLSGWRLSHRQAHAALPVALRSSRALVRYRDVALLAAALQDDLLSTSLRALYLKPLEAGRDAGKVAYETLRAYFAAGRNITSAAAALGVRRHTVASRLSEIEARIGQLREDGMIELELALRIDELTSI